MINRVTGDVSFRGLYISPHRAVESSHKIRPISLKPWRRHVLGNHRSAQHGMFEVEALSLEDNRVQLVLLSHQHPFYEPDTPEDAERRVFHESVISSELAGQREFSWGEVTCRFESALNQDWLVVAYKQQADVPLRDKEVLLHLLAHSKVPEYGTILINVPMPRRIYFVGLPADAPMNSIFAVAPREGIGETP